MRKKEQSDTPEPEESAAEDLPVVAEELDEGEEADEAEEEAEESLAANRFPIIGIGASAGGLTAFRQFFQRMPADSGAAFVLVQHLDPNHESMMADLLTKSTAMPIHQVEHGIEIEPNHIYIIPPGNYLDVMDGRLLLSEYKGERGRRLPIDHFLSSLADAYHELAIGIILSGTGTDGAHGVRDIKAAGGLTIAQEPESAEFEGMPRAAISTNQVDQTLPINEMAQALIQFVSHPFITRHHEDRLMQIEGPVTFDSILNVLRSHTEHDFRCYKKATLTRRIARRMSLNQIEGLDEYLERLRNDSDELNLLFKDLLISVTHYFRDADAWSALRDKVIAPLVARRHLNKEPIRIWVPGCATGEEAYSVAMLVLEQMDLQQKKIKLQVFGTDLDDDAIAVARNGVYPSSIEADVGTSRLRQFFTAEGVSFRTSKRLREATIFASQNLVSDPPFSRLDLICCRNVMIYLNSEIQIRLIELFHFALRDEGCLFVGSSESLGKKSALFEVLDKTWRIFQARSGGQPFRIELPALGAFEPKTRPPASVPPDNQTTLVRSIAERVHRGLSEVFVPPTIAVSYAHEVRYFHGPVARFLEFPGGEPNVNLFNMIPDEALRSKLSALMYRVSSDPNEGVSASVPAQYERFGETIDVVLHVKAVPAEYGGEPLLLVSFDQNSSKASQRQPVPANAADADDAVIPGGDLSAVRENLQLTVEQLETANEELKASNEEVMSMNEELQSANEELETSREELQSLNEELSTVNSQLSEKVDELAETNNDLNNLLSSTKVATIFLDTNFYIRRFTAATKDLLNIIDTDVGRPISDLALRIQDPALFEDARKVLDRLTPVEAELTHGQESWFLRRILPYRTAENVIDGVVITYHDVTTIKQTSKQLEARERQQAMVAQLGRKALMKPDIDDLFDDAAKTLAKSLDVDFIDVLEAKNNGKNFSLKAGVGWPSEDIGTTVVKGGSNGRAGTTLREGAAVMISKSSDDDRRKPDGFLDKHGVVSGVNVPIGHVDHPWGVLGAHARTPRNFTDDDVNLLDAIANILWSAIQVDLDFSRVVGKNEELRNRLDKLEG